MNITIHLEAEAKRVGIYNLNQLELEGIDSEAYDLGDQDDLARFMEMINSLVESQELELLEAGKVVVGINPEGIEHLGVSIDKEEEQEFSYDSMTLKNLPLTDPLGIIKRAQVGEIFYLRIEDGLGVWDLVCESEEDSFSYEKIEMGYYDCSEGFNSYDLITQSYYDSLCDTLMPAKCAYKDTPMQVDNFDYKPTLITGSLYRVIHDPESGVKTLERLQSPTQTFLDESDTEPI